MTTSEDIPRTSVNFSDPGFIRDPYPTWEDVRRAGSIVLDEPSGQYLVAGFKDCARIMGNSKDFGPSLLFSGLFGGTTMIVMDNPAHNEVRGIWARDFLRPSLEEQRAAVAKMVDSRVRPFVERIRSGETVEAVTGMTRSIPTIVIAELLGIPAEDHQMFSDWSDQMVGIATGFYDPTPRGLELVRQGEAARNELNEYLLQRIKAGASANTGLLRRMIESEVGRAMDIQDAVASVTQLVFAGNETTAILMSSTLFALAEYPDQREIVRRDRSLIPDTIEELVRWTSPAPTSWRIVREGGRQYGDHFLEEGAVVLCLAGAANRDPERWENPDEVNVTRLRKSHLGFGFGSHGCLGLNLARMESEIWLARILDEMPAWNVDNVDWGTAWVTRGPHTIDISA